MVETPRHLMRASQGRSRVAVILSGLTVGLVAITAPVMAATQPLASPEITGSLPLPEAPYSQRAFVTEAGIEGFELAARLEEHGGIITKPISWKVFRLLTTFEGGGELVFQGETAVADIITVPGDYRIELTYGFAHYSRVVTLEPRRRQSIAFNLNVGGLRVLSRLVSPARATFKTAHRIYALSGSNRQRLVAENAVPGDVLRLPAGRYRIESHLVPGNAIARSDIEVKAGVMSAVEIDHEAGIANLALNGNTNGKQVTWKVIDDAGKIAVAASGASLDVILAPGVYKVSAAAGERTLSRMITIVSGEYLELVLHP